jgi:hypothetical protein
MTIITTKSDSDEIVDFVFNFLSKSPSNLIRMDGICGSGKTTIAHKLATRIGGLHIEGDKFADKPPIPTPYHRCLNYKKMDDAISRAICAGAPVILDAVCLAEVAPEEKWGRGLRVYVKRLSFNSTDPAWHMGFELDDEPPNNEPDRSVHFYHTKFLPHIDADLIVEFPEEGHRLPEANFSRERCFDPINSVIMDLN